MQTLRRAVTNAPPAHLVLPTGYLVREQWHRRSRAPQARRVPVGVPLRGVAPKPHRPIVSHPRLGPLKDLHGAWVGDGLRVSVRPGMRPGRQVIARHEAIAFAHSKTVIDDIDGIGWPRISVATLKGEQAAISP
jgi:hypothetical protein